MKKLVITCAILSFASITSFAQTLNSGAASAQQSQTARPTPPVRQVTPEMIADRRASMYEKQYNLTAEQRKGVYEAELDYMKQDQQARANGGQPGQGQSEQMMMAKDAKFKKVLSAEQYSKYEASTKRSHMAPAAPQAQPMKN